MRYLRCFVLLFMFFSILHPLFSILEAAVPHLINYQGKLTDKAGKPLEGTYSVTFKIYDAENGPGTMAPWEEKYDNLVVQKGVFSVLLGSLTNLNLAFDKPYFLETKVGNEVMSPRQRIASVGYAIRAEKAETALAAENAAKVNNISANATPTANALLPLDSSGKFPAQVTGLKTYDSGWFPVSAGSSYTKTHNLGTTKVMITIMGAQNSDGSGWSILQGIHWHATEDYGFSMASLNNNQIKLQAAAPYVFHFINDNGQEQSLTSGYGRVIILALE